MLTMQVYVFFGLSILYGGVSCDKLRTKLTNSAIADYLPYQVLIQKNNNAHCGGIILDERNILTAAHCIDGIKPEDLSIVVGSDDLRTFSGERYQIEHVTIHENYQPWNGWPNDIALLHIETPIFFNKYVASAILPQRGQFWPNRQPAVISVFGKTNTDNPESVKPHNVLVHTENNILCQKAYPHDEVRATNMCTRHPEKVVDFCKVNSGGPLTINNQVVGIVSYPLMDHCVEESKAPQVYTRISEYRDWIDHWRQV